VKYRGLRLTLAITLVAVLVGGLFIGLRSATGVGKTRVTAYFDNSNGIYPGDQVRILGVPVGEIETIEPQPLRAKVTFWVDDKYKVPAAARAVILSPAIVTARVVQLTPAYTGGPAMRNNAVIPQERTAVPVEWDDLRTQLDKLSATLQPIKPGGVSALGEFVNSVADNLRGQGADIRNTVIRLSQSLSILGDHSGDVFGTVKNLAVLVSALHDSTDLMRQLNQNLAAVSALLANDPGAVGRAVSDLNTAVVDVRNFVAENRESLGVTSEKLSQIATALGGSLDDIKQALHLFPNTLQNFANSFQPAQNGLTGALAGANFQSPIQLICSAVQAASRLNAEQSAKLCVQYLAPIVKNRQYNFLGPIGVNPFVGTMARPNELTYSEDWLRPDFVPPAGAAQPAQLPATDAGHANSLAAEAPDRGPASPQPAAANPADGLAGLMAPAGAGS
jgi:phospholipid/cholesterol/gamma-HCH transport system substrate-binding protein